MIEIGKIQTLKIAREVPFGVYLCDPADDGTGASRAEEHAGTVRTEDRTGTAKAAREGTAAAHAKDRKASSSDKRRIDTAPVTEVLLPGSQVPEDKHVGDEIEVFVYRDSKDRPVATVNRPLLTLHEVGRLKVLSVTRIGAFLDWGLEKDLLLPYHEQRGDALQPGDEVLCAVYLDKSGRLCATMNVYHYLKDRSPYLPGQTVTGTAYETSGNFGVFVSVDDIYSALIPKQELVAPVKPGEKVTARVTKVREDGRLTLSLREKAYLQMDKDAQRLTEIMEENGGMLPFTDKASPERIRGEVGMSKNEFKRAVGRLLKEEKIEILEDSIVLTKEA